MKKNFLGLLLIILSLIIVINVKAETKCPDGYEVEGENCVQYTNAVKEFNVWMCYKGSKVTINGVTKCKVITEPINSEANKQETNQQQEKPKEEANKETDSGVNCKTKGKVCKCDDGYELNNKNWCVKYSIPFKEFNQWHCPQGSLVKIDGDNKCEIKKTPTLVDAPKTNNKNNNNKNNNNNSNNITITFDFCNDVGILKTFRLVGYAFIIIKILIPLLLIIFGAIDMGKAVVAGDEKAIKNASSMLMTRAIAGVIIFFIPTIIDFAAGLVADWTNRKTEFKNCQTCIFNTDDCSTIINDLEK